MNVPVYLHILRTLETRLSLRFIDLRRRLVPQVSENSLGMTVHRCVEKGLAERVQRGRYRITDRGRALLQTYRDALWG